MYDENIDDEYEEEDEDDDDDEYDEEEDDDDDDEDNDDEDDEDENEPSKEEMDTRELQKFIHSIICHDFPMWSVIFSNCIPHIFQNTIFLTHQQNSLIPFVLLINGSLVN